MLVGRFNPEEDCGVGVFAKRVVTVIWCVLGIEFDACIKKRPCSVSDDWIT